MTRQHFIMLANLLRELDLEPYYVEKFIEALSKENPRFSPERFREAVYKGSKHSKDAQREGTNLAEWPEMPKDFWGMDVSYLDLQLQHQAATLEGYGC